MLQKQQQNSGTVPPAPSQWIHTLRSNLLPTTDGGYSTFPDSWLERKSSPRFLQSLVLGGPLNGHAWGKTTPKECTEGPVSPSCGSFSLQALHGRSEPRHGCHSPPSVAWPHTGPDTLIDQLEAKPYIQIPFTKRQLTPIIHPCSFELSPSRYISSRLLNFLVRPPEKATPL